MRAVSEEHIAAAIARANLPALALAEIESLQADLEHERECTSQLYSLNCPLAARLEDLRAENGRLKAKLRQADPGIDYTLWR